MISEDVLAEFLEILPHVQSAEDVEGAIESLPRTNHEFHTSKLHQLLHRRVVADFQLHVNQAVLSGDIEDEAHGGVQSRAVENTLARLVASPAFDNLVDNVQAGLRRTTGLLAASGNMGYDSCPDPNSRLRDDTQDEHAKKRATRRDDWSGLFDICGGGFSPPVDIEAALARLETGLNGADGLVKALNDLSAANPETFNFGNHWDTFVDLAGRALASADPAVHAEALTTHWVMYEKAMGTSAADLCSNVVAHAHRYFATNVHVVSTRAAQPTSTANTDGSCSDGSLALLGDSAFICAAREARVLHGMLTTIHETFPHLAQVRLWRMIDNLLALFSNASCISHGSGNGNFPSGDLGNGDNSGLGDLRVSPNAESVTSEVLERDPPHASPPAMIMPAHFLAIAGFVDDWLPSWLRVLPTGRLIQALEKFGVVHAMICRCDLRGRVPLRPRNFRRASITDPRPSPNSPSVAESDLGAAVAGAAPTLVHHGLVSGACAARSEGPSGAIPLGRAVWLSLGELDHALLMQSISFLGMLSTRCRGVLRLCTLRENSGSNNGRSSNQQRGADRDERASKPEVEARTGTGVCGLDNVNEGREVLRVLVECFRMSRPTPTSQGSSSVPLNRPNGACAEEVGNLALSYIEQLARVTMGTDLSLFTPELIHSLLVPSNHNNHGTGLDREETRVGCMSDDGRFCSLDEDPAILGTLVDVASFLLSSRDMSAKFFVQGTAGLEASPALVMLIRCAIQRTKEACFLGTIAGCRANAVHGDNGDPGLRSLIPRAEKRQLAVKCMCMIVKVVDTCSPGARKAGWRALWKFGVPQASAELYREINRCVKAPAGNSENQEHDCESGSPRYCCDPDDEPNRYLQHKLLLSLAEWARDLEGVNALRRVGLVQACASCLSLELARRHLDNAKRDECADLRPLALAARLALCPEGIDGLLSERGEMVVAIQRGLDRLGELDNLAELVQSHTPDILRCHLRGVGNVGDVTGSRSDAEASADGVRTTRLPRLLNGDANLRCLDFVRLFSLASIRYAAIDSMRASATMRCWSRWAVLRAVPEQADDNPPKPGSSFVTGVPEDERLAGLQLLTDMAADLTVAVEIQAKWSLVARLAQWRELSSAAMIEIVARQADGGPEQNAVGTREQEPSASSIHTSNTSVLPDQPIGSKAIPNTVPVLDAVVLCSARLEAVTTRMGGPKEDLHERLRSIREAEAFAGGCGNRGESCGSDDALSDRLRSVIVSRTSEGLESTARSPSYGRASEATDSSILAILVSAGLEARSFTATESFKLLTEMAAPENTTLSAFPWVVTVNTALSKNVCQNTTSITCSSDELLVADSRVPDLGHVASAMGNMCFTYSCSLGFFVSESRDAFLDGLRRTLDLAAKAAADIAGSSTERTSRAFDCDWFAAVAYVSSGADFEASSEFLRRISRHPYPACFLWPLAGRAYAVARATPPRDSLKDADNKDQAISSESPLGAAAGINITLGDTPLLLLASLVEQVMEEELPCLAAALRRAGWAVASLAMRWMNQCMLNVLDWSGVVAYFALGVLRGPDFQVYFVVALLQHAQPRVVDAACANLDLADLLDRGEAMAGYDLEDLLSYASALAERYRSTCSAAMRAYLSA